MTTCQIIQKEKVPKKVRTFFTENLVGHDYDKIQWHVRAGSFGVKFYAVITFKNGARTLSGKGLEYFQNPNAK